MYKGFKFVAVLYFVLSCIQSGNAQELASGAVSEATASKPILIEIVVYEITGNIDEATSPINFRVDTNENVNELMKNNQVKTLSRPQLLVNEGQQGEIQICDQHPIEYFVKRPDGLFERKTVTEETGIKAGVIVRVGYTPGNEQPYFTYDLNFQYRFLASRIPIPDVELAIGEPVIQSMSVSTSTSLRAGKSCSIIGKLTSDSFLLVQMKGNYQENKE